MSLAASSNSPDLGSRLRVPNWSLGTVRRQSITYATGPSDDQTRVYWVQAHAMTGDIRIHPQRPYLAADSRLEDLDHQTLIALASVEGGVAATSWSGGVMSWADWIGFQPYDKYPEPGILHRIGPCMIELAPSGIYVEDWRFQPSAPGLMAGLRLHSEIDASGRKYARSGGFVIAGDHAICAIARRNELPAGTRAQDFVRGSDDPVAALMRVFDCTVDYAVKAGDEFKIICSTDPRREGTVMATLTGFAATEDPEIFHQDIHEKNGVSTRVWAVDSLEHGVAFPLETFAPHERLAWLEAEADTLIAPIERSRR